MNLKYNITGFLIQGLSDIPEHQILIFTICLIIYISIVIGNLNISVIILGNSRLHTPMYIFLMNLSTIDIFYASNILPNMLNMLLIQNNTMSFVGCMIQMYLYISLTTAEILVLEVMAYDRYIAICHPLHYSILMSLRQCAGMSIAVWLLSFLVTIGNTVLISRLSFCSSHLIDHFFCDIIPLLKLSCSSIFSVEIMNYIQGILLTFMSFLLTIISYIFIISTILKIKSIEGRRKAFSTCSSHLTCVVLYYGTLICLYMRPTSNYSPDRDKFFSLLYVVLIPLLNPIIYSLKNYEFKVGFRKLLNGMVY
ncbi:olfactory receptor 13G1-like [Pyxicephalus adspersus]|uniref:Olfactory receptor n=2 Tax=Pyxicephalus adspersus TaxID=30357 RepID=A0AAV2ZN08_PYXAD|nr:TPA: hypothetical protein GDO54_004385 [Pyxicephalus adspersus]